jgi:S1-C subfamily serine protease
MDENNKRDYGDFFKSQNEADRSESKRENADKNENMQEERPSYYYSYGPYKSSASEPNSGSEASSYATAPDGSTNSVEVTPPRPVRPFGYNDGSGQQKLFEELQEHTRKRSSVRSAFAAFMAGALVVGTLMFASDKMNLFTGGTQALSSTPTVTQKSGSSGGNDVKTAALDTSRPNSVAALAKQASPAVVKVESYVKPRTTRGGGNSLFNDPLFRQFFGDMFDNGQQQQQQPQQPTDENGMVASGLGTGFIFEKSGYILTNEHVIDGADAVKVYVQGNDKPYTAKVLGTSYDLDLAALKIEGDKDFPVLPIGNADDMQVGDWVVAIGNPYDFDYTVTVGVLSAKGRSLDIPDSNGTRHYKDLFQTDAAINPGNSGGPLINLNGEVIGINTAVNAQAQGMGFAIPTSTISQVLNNLKNNVKIPKAPAPYIGVQVSDVPQDYLQDLQLSNTDGALVQGVQRKSPAFAAGIRQYDVITAVNGESIKTSADLTKKVGAFKVGDKITVTIVRNGAKQDLTVTIGDRNTNSDLQNQ